MDITVTSPAFGDGEPIPVEHTGDGADTSPSIWWTGVPDGARELALIVDDPDAPRAEPWVHWVAYGILASLDGLPAGLPAERDLEIPPGVKQGKNDFGRIGYGGPAPPRGHGIHHYHFNLYALDGALSLAAGLTKRQLLEAIEGHVVGRGELIGTYQR